MWNRQLPLTLGIFAALVTKQVTAHGYCVKFGIAGKTYAGFNPTWAGGPSILGDTPQRPADNVNTEWADYTTEQVATGSFQTAEVGTKQLTAPANAGDKITIWYDQWPQPHSGPIMRYMANCGGSCDGVPAGDLDWFKIDEEGYTNGQWPNDRLLPANEWAQSFNLPTDLPAGDYLLANHMLAMHNVGEPQFYPVAFQIKLESSGTVDPQPKGKFPDIYLNGPQDFTTWNIYEQGANNANMKLPGLPVYSGSAGGGAAAPATPARPTVGPSAVSQSHDNAMNAAGATVQPTKTPAAAAGAKDKAPTPSRNVAVSPSQEAVIETPSKSLGKTADGAKVATPTTPPKAANAPEAAPSGGATVTVTIYADEARPTDINSETPIEYEGEMHAWHVNAEGGGEEEEPAVVVPSPPGPKKPSEKEEASAMGAHGVAHEDESAVQPPCPMDDENTVIPQAGEEEPAVNAPTLVSAIHIPTEEEENAAPFEQESPAEVPVSTDAQITSPTGGIDDGIVDDSIAQEPCPMDTEEAPIAPIDGETAAGGEVEPMEAALLAENPVAQEGGAVPSDAAVDTTTNASNIKEDNADISPIESPMLDAYETPPFDDDAPIVEPLPVVETAPAETPTFDMSHCVLRFDPVIGQYALDKRRSHIRALRSRLGWDHDIELRGLQDVSDPSPCSTYTLQGKDE